MHIRDDFPIFTTNPDLIYLDSAATLMKPQIVIDGVSRYLSNDYANIHRGAYDLSHRSEDIYERARRTIATFMWAADESELVFTSNSTDSANVLVWSLIRSAYIQAWDEILVSSLEHHANLLPWKLLAEQTGAKLIYIPIWSDGVLDPEAVYTYISQRTKIIALTLCSNVTGVVRDREIKEIAQRVSKDEKVTQVWEDAWVAKGPKREESTQSSVTPEAFAASQTYAKPLIVLDASQYVVHHQLDVQALGADFCFWTGHKLGALTGSWVLRWKSALLKKLQPGKVWGWAISSVHRSEHIYLWAPDKYEPWTPNNVAAHSLNLAVRYFCGLWWREIGIYITPEDVKAWYRALEAIEQPLIQYCMEQFGIYEDAGKLILLWSAAEHRIGVYSFVPHGIDISVLAQAMQDAGIALRTWAHCAHIYHQELWETLDQCDVWCVVQTCRISLRAYTSMEEVERFWEVMGEVYG